MHTDADPNEMEARDEPIAVSESHTAAQPAQSKSSMTVPSVASNARSVLRRSARLLAKRSSVESLQAKLRGAGHTPGMEDQPAQSSQRGEERPDALSSTSTKRRLDDQSGDNDVTASEDPAGEIRAGEAIKKQKMGPNKEAEIKAAPISQVQPSTKIEHKLRTPAGRKQSSARADTKTKEAKQPVMPIKKDTTRGRMRRWLPLHSEPQLAAYLGFDDRAKLRRWASSPGFLRQLEHYFQLNVGTLNKTFCNACDEVDYWSEDGVPRSLDEAQAEWPVTFDAKGNVEDETINKSNATCQFAYILWDMVQEEKVDSAEDYKRLREEFQTKFRRQIPLHDPTETQEPVWRHKADKAPDSEAYNRAHAVLAFYEHKINHNNGPSVPPESADQSTKLNHWTKASNEFWNSTSLLETKIVTDHVPHWITTPAQKPTRRLRDIIPTAPMLEERTIMLRPDLERSRKNSKDPDYFETRLEDLHKALPLDCELRTDPRTQRNEYVWRDYVRYELGLQSIRAILTRLELHVQGKHERPSLLFDHREPSGYRMPWEDLKQKVANTPETMVLTYSIDVIEGEDDYEDGMEWDQPLDVGTATSLVMYKGDVYLRRRS